jgi:hypothetical protein
MRMILLAAMAVAALAAENPWAKVMELKSGGEVRILKAGSPQPLLGTLDEAREDNVVVVVKNEEIAIPRDQILRLDYRTRQTGKHVTTKETRETETPPDPNAVSPRDRSTPSTSESTTYSFGSKPDFRTIYRRTASMPK